MEFSFGFQINRHKVIEAIVYLASKRPGIDVFHVLKVLFYADLEHFQQYFRPVLGDQYCAMKDGPVPSFAYDVIKRNRAKVDLGLLKIIDEKLNIQKPGDYLCVWAKHEFDRSIFSRTDVECLDHSIERYADMTFGNLWFIVHQEPSYKKTYVAGTSTPMPYETMLPENRSNLNSIISELKETSEAVVL